MKQVFHCCFFQEGWWLFSKGTMLPGFPPALSTSLPAVGLTCCCTRRLKKKKKYISYFILIPSSHTHSLSKQGCSLQWYTSVGRWEADGVGTLIAGVIPSPSSCARAALQACLVLTISFASCCSFFCSALSQEQKTWSCPVKPTETWMPCALWRHHLRRLQKKLSPSLTSPLLAEYLVVCSMSCLAAICFLPFSHLQPCIENLTLMPAFSCSIISQFN